MQEHMVESGIGVDGGPGAVLAACQTACQTATRKRGDDDRVRATRWREEKVQIGVRSSLLCSPSNNTGSVTYKPQNPRRCLLQREI